MSVSRKNLWDECRKKYYYQYHVKLKPEEPELLWFTYGKIVHKVAEEHIEKKKNCHLYVTMYAGTILAPESFKSVVAGSSGVLCGDE